MKFERISVAEYPANKTGFLNRQEGSFKVSVAQTFKELFAEMNRWYGGEPEAIWKADIPERFINNDGCAYSKTPKYVGVFPGVVLSFKTAKGRVEFCCDTYESWQHNLRAILLGIESLRAVDRYGLKSTSGDAQAYLTGYLALPPPSTSAVSEKPKQLDSVVSQQNNAKILAEAAFGEVVPAAMLINIVENPSFARVVFASALRKTEADTVQNEAVRVAYQNLRG
jgi:hypothetical protein